MILVSLKKIPHVCVTRTALGSLEKYSKPYAAVQHIIIAHSFTDHKCVDLLARAVKLVEQFDCARLNERIKCLYHRGLDSAAAKF